MTPNPLSTGASAIFIASMSVATAEPQFATLINACADGHITHPELASVAKSELGFEASTESETALSMARAEAGSIPIVGRKPDNKERDTYLRTIYSSDMQSAKRGERGLGQKITSESYSNDSGVLLTLWSRKDPAHRGCIIVTLAPNPALDLSKSEFRERSPALDSKYGSFQLFDPPESLGSAHVQVTTHETLLADFFAERPPIVSVVQIGAKQIDATE